MTENKIIELFNGLGIEKQANIIDKLAQIYKKRILESPKMEFDFVIYFKQLILKFINYFKSPKNINWNVSKIVNLSKNRYYINKKYIRGHSWQKLHISYSANEFEIGHTWILLRAIISEYYRQNYKYRRFNIEYNETEPGFPIYCSAANPDKMTALMLQLSGVCKLWYVTLKLKCVWKASEWAFIPGVIDPPKILGIPRKLQPDMTHIDYSLVKDNTNHIRLIRYGDGNYYPRINGQELRYDE
jgi:hypothetical protein